MSIWRSQGALPRSIERFNTYRAVWKYLERPGSFSRQARRTPPSKELDEMRRGPLQEQWVAICKRYPLISFKEKDFMARSSKR